VKWKLLPLLNLWFSDIILCLITSKSSTFLRPLPVKSVKLTPSTGSLLLQKITHWSLGSERNLLQENLSEGHH